MTGSKAGSASVALGGALLAYAAVGLTNVRLPDVPARAEWRNGRVAGCQPIGRCPPEAEAEECHLLVDTQGLLMLLALDLLSRVEPVRIDRGPPFSALFTLWLSMMAAVGLLRGRHIYARRDTHRDHHVTRGVLGDPHPRTKAYPRLHQPKPSRESSKAGAASHLPGIRYKCHKCGHNEEGCGLGGSDRRQAETSDPLH